LLEYDAIDVGKLYSFPSPKSKNWQLSKNRAKSLKQALIEQGISKTRINIYGEID